MNYQEKLRLAKKALDSGSYDKETIEYIFPELKESEDEKIRKELIEALKQLDREKCPVDILGFKTYCFLNGVREFVINPNRCRNHGTHGLHPATKEQRDLLFSKMKEAGYEWSDKYRKLIKIAQ